MTFLHAMHASSNASTIPRDSTGWSCFQRVRPWRIHPRRSRACEAAKSWASFSSAIRTEFWSFDLPPILVSR